MSRNAGRREEEEGCLILLLAYYIATTTYRLFGSLHPANLVLLIICFFYTYLLQFTRLGLTWPKDGNRIAGQKNGIKNATRGLVIVELTIGYAKMQVCKCMNMHTFFLWLVLFDNNDDDSDGTLSFIVL